MIRVSSESAGESWESALGRLLARHFGVSSEVQAERGVDFRTADGRQAIELKARLQSARDLRAALVQLAFWAGELPGLERASLVARFPRLGADRVRAEYEAVAAVLRPAIAKRLCVVGLAADGDVTLPDDAGARQLLDLAREADAGTEEVKGHGSAPARWSPKSYEVWKVLLDAWLRCEQPLEIQEIGRRSGASYPTVAGVLHRLERRGELARSKSRRASLSSFPRASLTEVIALGDDLRPTTRFVDRSGRPPSLGDLAKRISAKAPESVALGGVEAARHYMPTFDLNGLPRIDLTFVGRSTAWVKSVDPALREAEPVAGSASPILVLHRLRRPEPRFERRPGTRMPIADPAEVVLDLYEMRLDPQAAELVDTLRLGGERE